MQDYLLLMGLKGPQTFSRGERGSDFFFNLRLSRVISQVTLILKTAGQVMTCVLAIARILVSGKQ